MLVVGSIFLWPVLRCMHFRVTDQRNPPPAVQLAFFLAIYVNEFQPISFAVS